MMKDVSGGDPLGSPALIGQSKVSHAMPLTRRRALGALGVMGALGLGLLVVPQWRRVVSPGRVVDSNALARGMMPLSRDERAALGRMILAREPGRDHPREIVAATKGRVVLLGNDLVGPRDLGVVIDALNQRTRDDFANGRFEMIDRWYLSRTQRDVLALAAGAMGTATGTSQIGAAT